MAVSDAPWSQFASTDYNVQQWQRACVIDTETGAPESRDRYLLPVKEPSGEINRAGVYTAASKLNDVPDITPEQRSTAARKLLSIYNEMGEEAPEHITALASAEDRSAPDVERLWSTTFIRSKAGSPVELRNPESRTVGGYAAVFNRNSENLGGFIERVSPQFFNKSIADGAPGVVCRWNHSDMYPLGRTDSRTLRISKDNVGLNYEVDLPQCRSDVYEYIQRGDVRSSSFAFQCYEDEWRTGPGGYPERVLLSGKLIDVAPVTTPAYPDATVGLRSLARYAGAPIEDVVSRAKSDELRGFLIRTDRPSTTTEKKAPTSGRAALMEILGKRPEDPMA